MEVGSEVYVRNRTICEFKTSRGSTGATLGVRDAAIAAEAVAKMWPHSITAERDLPNALLFRCFIPYKQRRAK